MRSKTRFQNTADGVVIDPARCVVVDPFEANVQIMFGRFGLINRNPQTIGGILVIRVLRRVVQQIDPSVAVKIARDDRAVDSFNAFVAKTAAVDFERQCSR